MQALSSISSDLAFSSEKKSSLACMAGPNHSRAGAGPKPAEIPRREPALIQVQPDPGWNSHGAFSLSHQILDASQDPSTPGPGPSRMRQSKQAYGRGPAVLAGPRPTPARSPLAFATTSRGWPGPVQTQGRPRPRDSRTLRFALFYLVSFKFSGP